MIKTFSLCVVLLVVSTNVLALTPIELKQVNNVIQIFKKNNRAQIIAQIDYPLERPEPIPTIKNAAEMSTRFEQVFDQDLIDKIANSKSAQWSNAGWRGIMLDDGTVWLNGGKIFALNYSTELEKKLLKLLIQQQKNELYFSLKQFKSPEIRFKTDDYLVRIDEMPNGQFRYASWTADKTMRSKPELVLKKGKIEFSGSGGNHTYIFKSGPYIYSVDRIFMGADETPEVILTVEKSGKEILQQAGKLFH